MGFMAHYVKADFEQQQGVAFRQVTFFIQGTIFVHSGPGSEDFLLHLKRGIHIRFQQVVIILARLISLAKELLPKLTNFSSPEG